MCFPTLLVNEIIVGFLGPLHLPRHPESRPVTPFMVLCDLHILARRQPQQPCQCFILQALEFVAKPIKVVEPFVYLIRW